MDQRRWKVRRGDTLSWQLPVRLNGSPYNTSGCKFWMTGKASIDDLDAAALFQISSDTGEITQVGQSADGLMGVEVPATITVNFVPGTTIQYDVQILTPLSQVYTLEIGEFEVEADVTRRIV